MVAILQEDGIIDAHRHAAQVGDTTMMLRRTEAGIISKQEIDLVISCAKYSVFKIMARKNY